MDLSLNGKHALVCGASEGIGRAAAHELALLGADVTLLARRADVLETLVQALPRTQGQEHGWLSADVLDTDRLRAQVQALAAGKPVHILVNNTGGPPGGPVSGADSAAFNAPSASTCSPTRRSCRRSCPACRPHVGAASSMSSPPR